MKSIDDIVDLPDTETFVYNLSVGNNSSAIDDFININPRNKKWYFSSWDTYNHSTFQIAGGCLLNKNKYEKYMKKINAQLKLVN